MRNEFAFNKLLLLTHHELRITSYALHIVFIIFFLHHTF